MNEELFKTLITQLDSYDESSREESLERLSLELSCIDFGLEF